MGIARFNADGSLDAFNPDIDGRVYCIAVQADGKIIAGGTFESVSGETRHHLARLLPDGLAETGFTPDIDERVLCAAVQPDGKIIIGGGFTSISGAARHYIARLDASGSLDAGFNPVANASVLSLAIQEDGKILLGGAFTNMSGKARNYIARLHQDGTLDMGFNPDAGSVVHSLAIQSDGKIVAGGDFPSMGGVTRNRLARLHPDGSLDEGFAPNAGGGTVRALAVQTDGKICAGGNFVSVNGQLRRYFARLNVDGSLDIGYNDPGIYGSVFSVAQQADGGILVGGLFNSIGGLVRTNIARLHNDPATGSLQGAGESAVRWLRGGSSPEVSQVTFDARPSEAAGWAPLGEGHRISGGWGLSGLSLPGTGDIRARGRAGGSVIESIEPIRSAMEQWRTLNFGSPLNSGPAADTADPDWDGVPNLIEYALGLDPNRDSCAALPKAEVIGGEFVLDATQPASVSGITYGAEWSTTLLQGSWTAIPDTGTPPQHTFRVPVATNPKVFLRLNVTAP